MENTILLVDDIAINITKVCAIRRVERTIHVYFEGRSPIPLIWNSVDDARRNFEYFVEQLERINHATENKD